MSLSNSGHNSRKNTRQHYEKMANERNHELISVSNTETPSQGKLTIFCKTCCQEFTTTAKSYSNAKATGCTTCKAIKARNQKGASVSEDFRKNMQDTKKQKK